MLGMDPLAYTGTSIPDDCNLHTDRHTVVSTWKDGGGGGGVGGGRERRIERKKTGGVGWGRGRQTYRQNELPGT